VPNLPSHSPRYGMLLADERHNLGRTYLASLDTCNFGEIDRILTVLESEAKAITRSSGAQHSFASICDDVGQEFSLTVPVTREQVSRSARDDIRAAFEALHEHRYAHHFAERAGRVDQRPPDRTGSGAKTVDPPPDVKAQATKTVRYSWRAPWRSTCRSTCGRRAVSRSKDRRTSACAGIRYKDDHLRGRRTRDEGFRRNDNLIGKFKVKTRLDPVTLEIIRNTLPGDCQ